MTAVKLRESVEIVSGFKNEITTIDFPSARRLTVICDVNLTAISELNVPDSVQILDEFSNCENLTTVAFPIAGRLNQMCGVNFTPLSSVQFPDSVTIVGDFSHQTFRRIVTFPAASQLNAINAFSFSCFEAFECPSLTIERIDRFQGCNALQQIVFPSDGRLREICGFQCASVQTIVIQRSVESLTNGAFNNC
jgi:hypothetical protein